ncbi:2-dehydropantoate 2-reductase [Halobacillus sp. BAB-2008]|uniref:2-dehydropantoate 2-reductase n=1 Tax=Halobacillus sp. BAB-2008 TaxID=1246484 RepID=UPI0002A4E867|nr:2-dehydropantoate 2-reductase [Halobacillus sp. BAB-2008]ELK45040.1 2-dehydropantoate 2-reductase [Halobacillus sp. BAB-2008]
MKIGIVGAGAVGLLAGAYLGRHHEVHMIVRREEQRRMLTKNGIACDTLESPVPVKASCSLDEEVDLILLTVKQHHLPDVLDDGLPAGVPLLFLQNGMTHYRRASIDPRPCFTGIVEHGARKENDCSVRHTGKGVMRIAPLTDEGFGVYRRLFEALAEEDFPIYLEGRAETMLKKKLLVNAVINPVTAVFKVRNGELLTNPYLSDIARKLCEEACDVLSLSFPDEWDRVCRIAEKTGSNHSSMLVDLMEGRQTEVDAISGYILEEGTRPLPYHEFIVTAVRAIEWEEGGNTNE